MRSGTAPALVSLLLMASAAATAVPAASAHQIDSVGQYRIQIGWMQEPAVSGEPNGIELYVSPLDPALAPENQEFKDGISGLYKDLKIQLILKGNTTTLPLRADHNVPGKYFALVEPTIPGFYQVNILGSINDTIVSKSLHAPKVENEEYLRFPPLPESPILKDHENFEGRIAEMERSVELLESSQPLAHAAGYGGLAAGIAAVAISIVALRRK